MLDLTIMEDSNKLKIELERTKIELGILYEISNAMRTTLKLDEILYIILTGVTAHTGLGFNRAILFLVNETEQLIEGKMGIGPENGLHDLMISRQFGGNAHLLHQGVRNALAGFWPDFEEEIKAFLDDRILAGKPKP